MTACEWIPEQYPPSGTIGAAGFYKLLGRPEMDPLTLLVRETAQNSWDARAQPDGEVAFSLAARRLGMAERTALFRDVFVSSEKVAGTQLSSNLADPGLIAMYVSDRNTKGLGGPLLASRAEPTGVYDWVDFVLNVGKANTQGHTGGTYGFGKTITYVVSEANSIVVYSRARFGGEIVSRLIACAIGGEFEQDGSLFTGRHWWGASQDGAPTPVESDSADALAASIGMPAFEGEDLGTTVMIVSPDFGGRTPRQGMAYIAESALWNLWPKLVERAGRVPMSVSVSWQGESIPVPTPDERPPLAGFVQAFRELIEVEDDGDEPPGYEHQIIRRLKPADELGDLATVPMVVQPRAVVDDGHDPENPDSPPPAAPRFQGGCHHVALLRDPELVIEYLEGPPSPEGSMEWAGVFKCRVEFDGAFAQAEPPTHDSWRPELIEDRKDKSAVKVALQKMREALEGRWGSRKPVSPDAANTSTAAIAAGLSHLVGASAGAGPGRTSIGPGGGSSKRNQGHVELLSSGPAELDGRTITRAVFRVTPDQKSTGTLVDLAVGVALDQSASDAGMDPELALLGIVLGTERLSATGTGARFSFEGASPTDVEVMVARSDTSSVLFDVRIAPTNDLPSTGAAS